MPWCFFWLWILLCPSVFGQDAIALDGEPKYKHFKHFDYANPSAPKGGSLRSYVLGSFDSLNPFLLKGNPAEGLELVYDTLMAQSLDEPYSQYGLLADSIEVAKDHYSVIFHINPLAHFNDGVPVSAEDVKFSFDTLMSKGSVIYHQYYADVKEARVLDRSHVQFLFRTNQNRELPLILGQLQILPKHFYWKNGKNTFGEDVLQKPLGSGPYSVKSYDLGKKIIYERNPNYWARDLPVNVGFYNFDFMVYEYYKEESVALKAFLKGDYDWRLETTAKVWARGYVGKAIEQGKIKKVLIKNDLPSGMQGFFMNTRKKLFQNPLVREALLYAFDAQWSNRNLFFSQYSRTLSFFNHSIYAMSGLPSKKELEILQPYAKTLNARDPRILKDVYIIPRTDGEIKRGENLRENLKYARDLLKKAGFVIENFALVDERTKEPFVFTLTLGSPAFERLALSFAKNLQVLGITMNIEVVDSARYKNLVQNFDYDMIVAVIGQSLFPGNEQNYYWGSKSAAAKGSRNYAGIKDPVVDSLIKRLVNAKNKEEQIFITKALDRVLCWGFYVIPHFYLPYYRIAYDDRIKMPKIPPRYGINPALWWSADWHSEGEKYSGREK
ncbi:extracellular solute-binding protein [Helicobacter mustelae]|uniref:Putative ABC transport system, substrate-binding protein n=1 Tax=Helicobacter mustelae (strain ATCC 43772 / CCUG 25715 / CIP 103759 / LMG 18044 / NCTC 12198 / R85-136P) TaxID=679897 RepID=D3UIB5_HELM1|nr:extracellular solute-binding protein [Helicobacter mustelae]CBG40238.1 putative ABC transport system, substrate-binding protein [Helicobacter mustelae 12198]